MKTFKKYGSIFQITLINSLAYPGELIGRSLMIIPFMWIFYQLWKVTYAASGMDVINGLSLRDVLWYLMMAETIELGRPPLARTISDNVKDGSIAYLLNKPYDFLLYQEHDDGETICALMSAVFRAQWSLWLVGAGHPEGFIIACPPSSAWILHFCVTVMIGLSAFVVEDVSHSVDLSEVLCFRRHVDPIDLVRGSRTLPKHYPFRA
jgi:ABC-2 type transport system permease protein